MIAGTWAAAAVIALGLLLGSGCGVQADVGSDVLWSARFEGDDFSEWTNAPGGSVDAFPAPNMFETSSEVAHHGRFAAKLTVDTQADGTQANVGLSRAGNLPVEAYYSAWYYLPRSVTVGTFWVIFKFRMRSVADDPSTSAELYDLDLTNLPSGEMSLRLYDHRSGDIPLDVASPVVPVGVWFQIEAFYSNVSRNITSSVAQADAQTGDAGDAGSGAGGAGGRLTFWLDGKPIVDVTDRPMAPTPWVAWDVVSVAVDLTPSASVLYVDDCALSRTRVGPTGLIAR